MRQGDSFSVLNFFLWQESMRKGSGKGFFRGDVEGYYSVSGGAFHWFICPPFGDKSLAKESERLLKTIILLIYKKNICGKQNYFVNLPPDLIEKKRTKQI